VADAVALGLAVLALLVALLSLREARRADRARRRAADARARADAIGAAPVLDREALRRRAAEFDRQAVAGMQERAKREGRQA
jgi:hypothetical protein